MYLGNKSKHFKSVVSKDFSGQNLRGRSFKGQNLEGANFIGADIRGVDFSSANLKGANFSYATAGLQKRWGIFLICVLFLICGAIVFHLGTTIYSNKISYPLIGSCILLGINTLFVFIIRRNLKFILIVLVILTFAFVLVLAVALLVFLIGVVVADKVANSALSITTLILEIVYLILVLFIFNVIPFYFTLQVIEGNEKISWLYDIVVTFLASLGTRFYKANLTNANFTKSLLENTSFKEAILNNTYFEPAIGFNFINPGKTYLQKDEIRKLLTTRNGQNKVFDREDLRGINLQGANLAYSSFIGANLSEANLQDADLSGANLVQTQLDGTNFMGATLTGACIEDWGITIDTKLDEVRCEYVYMRLSTKENRDPLRKPDNNREVFTDGEFGDFIKPMFDTLDLYHNQGVDPRAIAISFKQLAENHPEADLRIVGVEVKGEDKLLLRAKTSNSADKSELSNEYFSTYNQIKGLPEAAILALVAEKDSQIRRLENMVMTALERPSFYSNVEQVGNMTNNPGGFSVGSSVGGNINNVQGDGNKVVQGSTNMTGDRTINTNGGNYNEDIQGNYIQGDDYSRNLNISGGTVNASGAGALSLGDNIGKIANTINNYASKQHKTLAEAVAEIQELLKQIEQTNPTATESEQITHINDETTPKFKRKVAGALKAAGETAIDEFILDNKYLKVTKAAVKGWMEIES